MKAKRTAFLIVLGSFLACVLYMAFTYKDLPVETKTNTQPPGMPGDGGPTSGSRGARARKA